MVLCGISRERKHRKSPDGEKSDSSESFRTSDNEDIKKDERYPGSDEKYADYEAQVGLNYAVYLVNIITYKWICLHIPVPIFLYLQLKQALREDKSKLEVSSKYSARVTFGAFGN
jgi:hypothetical protein